MAASFGLVLAFSLFVLVLDGFVVVEVFVLDKVVVAVVSIAFKEDAAVVVV